MSKNIIDLDTAMDIRVRIYLTHGKPVEEAQHLQKGVQLEFRLLEGIEHAGILMANVVERFSAASLYRWSLAKVLTSTTCVICAYPIRDAVRPELSWTHYRRFIPTVMPFGGRLQASCLTQPSQTAWQVKPTNAGKLFNAAIADHLACEADKVITDNMCISFAHGVNFESLANRIRAVLNGSAADVVVRLDDEFIQELKFSECLSQQNINKELAARYRCEGEFVAMAGMKLCVLHSIPGDAR